MTKRTITIEGDSFSDLDTFFDEIDRVMTKDLDWKTGHNMNSLNDLLWGGFGIHEYEEPVDLVWKKLSASRTSLGDQLIDEIVLLIKSHDHIDFHAMA